MIVQGPHTGLKGVVKEWQVINNDGSIDQQGGSFENLILDQGLDQVANTFLALLTRYCAVGTGTAAPAQTDTGLVNESARTGNLFENNSGTFDQEGNRMRFGDLNNPISDIAVTSIEHRRTFEFPVGSLDSNTDGDYGELGFSSNNSSGTNLFSRTLFRDGSDNPITVTVNSDQALRITYGLFIQPGPASQTSTSANITNVGTINFNHMFQELFNSVDDGDRQMQMTGMDGFDSTEVIFTGGFANIEDEEYNLITSMFEPSISDTTIYDSSDLFLTTDVYTFIGAGENASFYNPSIQGEISNISVDSYTNGNYYVDRNYVWEPASYNDEVASVVFINNYGNPLYALVVDSADRFTKADTHRLTLTFRLSWGRA